MSLDSYRMCSQTCMFEDRLTNLLIKLRLVTNYRVFHEKDFMSSNSKSNLSCRLSCFSRARILHYQFFYELKSKLEFSIQVKLKLEPIKFSKWPELEPGVVRPDSIHLHSYKLLYLFRVVTAIFSESIMIPPWNKKDIMCTTHPKNWPAIVLWEENILEESWESTIHAT